MNFDRTNHRHRTIAAAVVLSILAAAGAAAAETARTFQQSFPAAPLGGVALEVPVGDVGITGDDGDEVQVAVAVRCPDGQTRCQEAAKAVRLEAREVAGKLRLEIDGWPEHGDKSLKLTLDVTLPRELSLDLEVGVGEVQVAGLADDVAIDLGVGETSLRTAERHVREVNVDIGVGEARLAVGGRTLEGSGFLGRTIRWTKGPGRARLAIDCGVGQATVTLEE